MCQFRLSLAVFLFLSSLDICLFHEISLTKTIRECFGQDHSVICLKERALDIINGTIASDKPIHLYGIIDIVKDPNYNPNNTEVDVFLPQDIKQRSSKLNDLIYEKLEEFFDSRTVKLNLGNMFEGRGKKDKKGGMLMMGGLAMAGMMAQMFMGKIAFMAGAAMLMAKIALMISTVIGIKKLGSNGGGGESQHVVYSSGGDSYGGGWHRSMGGNSFDVDAQNLAYRSQIPETNYNY